MQKVIIEKSGGYKVLEVKEFSDFTTSEILENQVLVEIKYFGINMADIFVRLGLYAKANEMGYPLIPGFEFSGIVKFVGKNVNRFKVGARVAGINIFNCYATQIIINQIQIIKIPESLSLELACALPVNYLTAFKILENQLGDKKILIQSAMGGVGQALINLSIFKNFKIYAVVGNLEKVKIMKEKFKFYQNITLVEKANYFKISEKFDLIAHSFGGKFLKKDLSILNSGGKLIVFGFNAFLKVNDRGELPWYYYLFAAINYFKMPSINIFKNLVSQNVTVQGINLAFSFEQNIANFEFYMNQLFALIQEGKIVLPEVNIFDLKNIAEAHRHLEDKSNYGKVLIKAS